MLKSRRFLKIPQVVFAVLSLALLLTQFNNCGNYAQPATGLDGDSIVSCTNVTCVTPDANNLQVTPHLGNGSYSVPANLTEFNIGGDCNEAGFPTNIIHWDLMLNGTSVRNSSQQIAGANSADSKCVNGRFMLYINLAPIPQDQVDRTGLSDGAGHRPSYNLNITIYGQAGQGVLDPNVSFRSVIPLQAI